MALNNMNWRKGIKLIIHIEDDGADGEEFIKGDKHSEERTNLTSLIKNDFNIIGFKIGKAPNQSFEKITVIYNEYTFFNKGIRQFIEN